MDTVVDLLSHFVNPWTVLVLVLVLIFRRPIANIIASLERLPRNVSELRVRGMKLLFKRREEIAQRLVAAAETGPYPEGAWRAMEADARRLARAVVHSMGPKDLGLFTAAFFSAGSVVAKDGSPTALTLSMLKEHGAVEERRQLLQAPDRMVLREYALTEIGRLLLQEIRSLSDQMSRENRNFGNSGDTKPISRRRPTN